MLVKTYFLSLGMGTEIVLLDEEDRNGQLEKLKELRAWKLSLEK